MSPSDVESKLGLNRGAAPGFKRLRLTVAYCGTPWRGWQSQEGGGAIQDELNAAFLKAIRAVTNVQGSGRTDAGVHALGQVAHCDVPDSLRLSPESWVSALNSCLPLTIRITDVTFPELTFHSRYDAVGKIYRYRLWKQPMLSPFEADRAWHVYGKLDMDLLRDCTQMLVGTHNFVRLSANRGDMPETLRRSLPHKTTRTIHRAEVIEKDGVIELEFEGNGFLYKMVRMITGTLVHVARGRATRDWFADVLSNPQDPQSNQTAPSCGLYLVRVLYPEPAAAFDTPPLLR
jgi:tRNA pseudouridine38-40 synthase